jgi:peptidoglycan hydrolase CwlO-like protein
LDAVLTAVLQSTPQLGIGGVLVVVIVLLLRREVSTEDRHASELRRVNEAHDAELRELRDDIQALRKQIGELQAAIDREREERRRAEDQVAELSRGRGGKR